MLTPPPTSWLPTGQRDIRSIWPKYYSECHAVCFVIDSTDKSRIEECWRVFETIVTDHRVDGVPTLVLANKQDHEDAMAVEEIKQMFNQLIVGKLNVSEGGVMPISALRGYVRGWGAWRGRGRSGEAELADGAAGTGSGKQFNGCSCECKSQWTPNSHPLNPRLLLTSGCMQLAQSGRCAAAPVRHGPGIGRVRVWEGLRNRFGSMI